MAHFELKSELLSKGYETPQNLSQVREREKTQREGFGQKGLLRKFPQTSWVNWVCTVRLEQGELAETSHGGWGGLIFLLFGNFTQ